MLKMAGGTAVAGGLLGGAGYAMARPSAPASAPEAAAPWHSKLVRPGPDGKLVYAEDANKSRIPDFSWAGYRNGEAPLPDVPVLRTISPVSGDNTEHIQKALDEVGALPLDANGFRGTVLLRPGTYPVAGTIRIAHSGVVLRGAGPTDDPAVSSIIKATGKAAQQNVILVGGAVENWSAEVPGSRTDVVSDFVQVGSRTFTVADASKLKVGDNIIVFHPHTAEWLKAIDNGGVDEKPPWPVGKRPIIYNRYVKAVSGNEITICAPVFNHLERKLSQSYVYKWDNGEVVRDAGVESLRIDIQANSAEDEDHARNGVQLKGVEDAWVRNCRAVHFVFAGFDTHAATRCTILDSWAYSPRSQIIGSRRYNFNAGNYAQQVLFRGLTASYARHAFVASGTTKTSGCAWVDGVSRLSYSESGGHHRWSQGLLFDNISEIEAKYDRGHMISLHNRIDHGSGHGWSSVHSVAWNCTVDDGKWVTVQRPPTAQNYAIGTTGAANGKSYQDLTPGFIEGTNKPGLAIKSLYDAQLADRLR
ncbi:hypothetical protein EV193_102484 [Herbihabitans rhizosphaerae]|uniref:Pectate lyase-like protein n=2 Tax=Herbihabitans rhizosphaerae TaxID=1872711 RepID=A0A4Q7L2W4_9PSEU|nr:hypothetical protein EV193_102484 [Herbihabitans rhizosphaerae]